MSSTYFLLCIIIFYYYLETYYLYFTLEWLLFLYIAIFLLTDSQFSKIPKKVQFWKAVCTIRPQRLKSMLFTFFLHSPIHSQKVYFDLNSLEQFLMHNPSVCLPWTLLSTCIKNCAYVKQFFCTFFYIFSLLCEYLLSLVVKI